MIIMAAGRLIVFEGLNRYVEALSKKAKDIEKVDKVVKRNAFRVERQARINAPVKSGVLRSSIHTLRLKKGVYAVVDGVDYGIFQEFGTSHFKGRFFLTKAMKKNRKKLIEDIKKLID